jgi:hypothetical protein
VGDLKSKPGLILSTHFGANMTSKFIHCFYKLDKVIAGNFNFFVVPKWCKFQGIISKIIPKKFLKMATGLVFVHSVYLKRKNNQLSVENLNQYLYQT